MIRCLIGTLLGAICLLTISHPAEAGTINAYVGEFAVTGVSNREELKATLQTLLASRLKGEIINTVDAGADADIIVTGSYVVFGKVFSVDAVVRDTAGKVVTRAFEQGEGQDDLLPALGKLAKSLSADIVKIVPARERAYVAPPPVSAAPKAPTQAPVSSELVRKGAPPAFSAPAASDVSMSKRSAESEFIRPEQTVKQSGSTWISQRLEGVYVGIAPGRTLENGTRELFAATHRALRLYRQEQTLKLVVEVTLPLDEKILAIDTADLDDDGNPEVYLTVMNGEDIASQVWVTRGTTLARVVNKLPYFFRGITRSGQKTKMYAQQQGLDKMYYGDVAELKKKGDGYELGTTLKLPRFGNLYNFNFIADKDGKPLTVVLNDSGYLIIYSPTGEEIWRTSDTFGGTENFYHVKDLKQFQVTGDPNLWVYIGQRFVVAESGEIIVPQNTGFFVVGNQRSYTKNSIFSFTWNGSSLEENWHTKISPNYLADFYLDGELKELVILEVAKKEGIISKGGSVVTVKRLE